MKAYAIMPKSDYVEACNRLRSEGGHIGAIRSSELATAISSALIRKQQEGYNAGVQQGGGTKVLYGSYHLKPDLEYSCPDNGGVHQTFSEEDGVKIYSANNSNFPCNAPCSDMIFSSRGISIVRAGTDGDESIDYVDGRWQLWDCDYFEPHNQMYRIIEFTKPLEVSDEFYEAFMDVVDNFYEGETLGETCAYTGWEIGFKDGERSFADTLYEFAVLSSSSSCIVMIRNNHPYLFLHLYLEIDNSAGNENWSGDCVVAPGEISENSLDSDRGGAEWTVYTEEVRFSESEDE